MAVAALLGLAALLSPLPTLAQASTPKQRIEKAADLPRFSYPVAAPLEDIVRSADLFAPLAQALRRDTERVLADYDIPDKGTRRDLISQLAVLDYLDGRYASALARADEVRTLQDKPADKLLSGLRLRAMASAALAHAPGSDAHRRAVGEFMRRELAAMPKAVVDNDIKQAKASAGFLGEGLMLGRVREVLQPMATAAGALSNEFAPGLVNARFGLLAVLPLKATLTEVYTEWLAKNSVEKADIWAARDVTLDAGDKLSTVKLAVWDSGVDTALFPRQLHRDAAGAPVVIAFDRFARPSPGALQPISAELVGAPAADGRTDQGLLRPAVQHRQPRGGPGAAAVVEPAARQVQAGDRGDQPGRQL